MERWLWTGLLLAVLVGTAGCERRWLRDNYMGKELFQPELMREL